MNYSGNDAGEVLKETQTLYGTLPKTIDFYVSGNKIQLNRNGLMVVRNVNSLSTRIILEISDSILKRQKELLSTSEKFQTATKTIGAGSHTIRVPTIIAGKIRFGESKFDTMRAKILLGRQEMNSEEVQDDDELEDFNFSFIDTYVADDAYSATAVDEQKGTVFGLSGDNEQMVLIPKHRTTFESFVRFYVGILESFDRSATLTTFGEQIAR
jgi:hypothetical protein